MKSQTRNPLSSFMRLLFEKLFIKLIKLAVLSYALAWLLACTSVQTLSNIPIAVAVVLALYWLSSQLIFPHSIITNPLLRNRRYRKFRSSRREHIYKERQSNLTDRDAWKKLVNAPIVESAWESFCGSIVQEWIYDTWYSLITPDREFPAEIRRLLNEAFAEIAQRARKVDLRTLLLRDMCDLFCEQLELYRHTKLGMGILKEGDIARTISVDRAFQQEMKTDRTLHAAFYSRDGHYRMIRRMSEGVISILLKREDVERPVLRSLVRELLGSCVLRGILLQFTPYTANKILLSLLTPRKDKKKFNAEMENENSKSDKTDGCVQFDRRVRKSVALENRASRTEPESSQYYKKLIKTISSKSQSNLRAFSENTDSEDLDPNEEERSRTEHETVDLKEIMEETDLLDSKNEPDVPSEPSVFQTPTSLPWMPTSKDASLSDEGESTGFIDSQITIEDISFVGRPRARVVAPEINTNGRREYVVFKIRVADKTGEWTVTRRYRNFEALHKFLRDLPVYRQLNPRLPPKTFVFQGHKTEVVEQRRIALDKYLQTILSNEALAFNRHVWLFLSDQQCRSFTPEIKVGLINTIANNVDTARYRIQRSVGSKRASKVDNGKKENALRTLEDSETSSVSGSVRNDDDLDLAPSKLRMQNGGYSDSPLAGTPRMEGMSFSDGRKSPVQTRTQRHVGFASTDEHSDESESKTSKPPRHETWLSRVDYESRDPFQRQPELPSNGSLPGMGAAFSGRKATLWAKFLNSELSGSDEDDDRLDLGFDDSSGISAPLYEVADAIFDFPAQKFFRRQVFVVMRQLLSFLAGDAIDVYLNKQIQRLRSEHTLARLIHHLKSALWPNGVWFAEANHPNKTKDSNSASEQHRGLPADRYLESAVVPPDAEEKADLLRIRLFRHAPAALVRLVGRNSYMGSMKDVYDMLQLQTFVRQIGYGVLEIVLLALFPELKDLFAKIHKEAKTKPTSRT